MSELMEEQYQHIHDVYKAAQNLRVLHQDVSYYEHALTKSRSVKPASPFIPTFFLYIFFAFNTIFSIDWKRSLKNGMIVDHNRYNERKRINKLISFCFSDTGFVSSYYPTFLEILFIKFNKDDLFIALKGIAVDNVRITDNDKLNKIYAFKKILTE